MPPAAYTVTLHHPSLPRHLCLVAETQYRRVLEQSLDGSDGVAQAWRAWQETEHTQGTLPTETWNLARQWLIAAEHARKTALRHSLDAPEAYFEVQHAQKDAVVIAHALSVLGSHE